VRSEHQLMAEIHYNIFTNVRNRVSQGPEFGRCHLQNNNWLSKMGIPMLEMKQIMTANQIHCISISYNYINCSREKYTMDIHLKINRIYASIIFIFEKLVMPVAGDEAFKDREKTSIYS
jgi:hypothetical protein